MTTSRHPRSLIALLCFATIVAGSSSALGAGSESGPPTTRSDEATTVTTTSNKSAPAQTTTPSTPTAGKSAGALYEEGKAAISRKDWNAAIAAFSKAAELEPNNADVHNLLGYSYRKTGNYKLAFANYAIALKLNPAHVGALEYQGEAYAETGNITKAKANLAKLKSISGTDSEEYKDLNAFIKAAQAKSKKTKKK